MGWRGRRAKTRFATAMSPSYQSRSVNLMKPFGDRRARIRLEVVGSLWGTFEVTKQARVVNISRNGALISSPVPAAVDSTQTVRLMLEGHEIKLAARVRHLRQVSVGDEPGQYRIGLEFLEAPIALAEALE